MPSITFLGTGGGRFVLVSQRRYTGGIWLDIGARIILDPGPGSLVRAIGFGKKPEELDAVLVSHKHLDHYGDAEAMIEAMTYGTKKRGGLLVINEKAKSYISEYHQGAVEVIVPRAGEDFMVGGVKITAIPTHEHADGIGFRFRTEKGDITYSSDTAYSRELLEHYRNSKILILNVIFPKDKGIDTHLNTEKAKMIIDEVRPKLAIIQHFGRVMLNAGPDGEAAWIEKETGVRTIAARDGMTVDLEDPGARDMQSSLAGF